MKKFKKLFELGKNLVDEMFAKGQTKFSLANFKHEEDAVPYINLLKIYYIISLKQDIDDYNFFWNLSFFKVINFNPSKAIEKNLYI